MYRYRDARGMTRTVADADALRAAISGGLIPPGSPFAGEDGSWTVASRHPAYQAAAKQAKPRGPTFANSPAGRLGAVALVAVVTFVAFKDRNVSPAEAERYLGALAAMVEAETVPPELAVPPTARSLRESWVILHATRDVMSQMDATQARLGFADEPPDAWLTQAYVLDARDYPEVAEHWIAVARFHQVYRDSIVPLTEAATRRHAATAGIDGDDLEDLVDEFRTVLRPTLDLYRAAQNMAGAAHRLHRWLTSVHFLISGDQNGGLVFVNQRMVDSYEKQLSLYEAFLDEMDSIAAESNANLAAAMAKVRD